MKIMCVWNYFKMNKPITGNINIILESQIGRKNFNCILRLIHTQQISHIKCS